MKLAGTLTAPNHGETKNGREPTLYGQAREVFGVDPSSRLLARAQDQAQQTRVPLHLLEGSAERIPLTDRSMDTVVMTWTGCSIPDIRVLTPGGICCSWSTARSRAQRGALAGAPQPVLGPILGRMPLEPQDR
jgi:methyltransferase family protein